MPVISSMGLLKNPGLARAQLPIAQRSEANKNREHRSILASKNRDETEGSACECEAQRSLSLLRLTRVRQPRVSEG